MPTFFLKKGKQRNWISKSRFIHVAVHAIYVQCVMSGVMWEMKHRPFKSCLIGKSKCFKAFATRFSGLFLLLLLFFKLTNRWFLFLDVCFLIFIQHNNIEISKRVLNLKIYHYTLIHRNQLSMHNWAQRFSWTENLKFLIIFY